jgi:hypothetical protein
MIVLNKSNRFTSLTMMLVLSLFIAMTWIVAAYDAVTTSDKMEYFIGETIYFTHVGIEASFSNHFILPEADIPILFTSGSPPRWYYRSCYAGKVSTNSSTITTDIVCSWENSYDIFSVNALLSNNEYTSDSVFPYSTNISLITNVTLDTNFVFITYEVIGNGTDYRYVPITVSNPFKFKLNDMNITLDKSAYVQGESMQLTFQQSYPNALMPSYNFYQYIKVYQVPFSYKNDVLKFNTARQVKYVASESEPSLPIDKQLITWQQSGNYQMVLFNKYYQIVLGVSDVFTVQKELGLKSFNVSMDNQTYHPHQPIDIEIIIEGTDNQLVGRQVSFTFVGANATQRDLDDLTKVFDVFTLTWFSTSLHDSFQFRNTMVKPGFYKLFVSISSVARGTNYALHVTKAFRVLNPLIVMTRPRRRTYIQGEVINVAFYNPYFDFSFGRREYYQHLSFLVSVDFPSPGDANPTLPDIYDYFPIARGYYASGYYQNFRIVLRPGKFKIVIFRDISGQQAKYMTTIRSTTITVVQNNFTVTTDKDHYKKGDTIYVKITSSRNIPLLLFPSDSWELTIKENDDPNYQYIFSYAQQFISSSSPTTLNAAIDIFWDETGVFTFTWHEFGSSIDFTIR